MKAVRILVAVAVLVVMLVAPSTALAQEEDWVVRLSLTTNPNVGIVPGAGYTFAFGAQDGATEGFSAAEGDQVAPPDPMAGVNAYFFYPANPMFQRNLITSVVGPGMTITWPLLVKSVGDPGVVQSTLTWDEQDIGDVPAKYGVLELRDTDGNTLANMMTESSYTFTLPSNETKNFHVVAEAIPTFELAMAVAPPDSGTAVDLTDASPYGEGAVVQIVAEPAVGYRFMNWTAPAGVFGNANAAETTFTMPAQVVTVTANFVQVYALTMAAAPEVGGTAIDLTDASPYTAGTLVSIRAEAEAGYRFVNWTTSAGQFGDAGEAETTFTMPGEAATVTANFEEIPPDKYALTMSAAPEVGGTATDLTDASPYEEGTVVQIEAEPALGYRFVHWTAPAGFIANPNAAQTTFTMPAQAVTVTASFEELPSVDTDTGTGTAYFQASLGTIEELQGRPVPADPPVDVTFPHGMFSFQVTGLNPGDEVTITVELPSAVPAGTKWWKYHDGQWHDYDIPITISGNTVTITLTDGGVGDIDDIAGQITDPGGPGVPTIPPVGGTAYPINRLPILAFWIALAAVAAGVSMLALRRRRA